MKNQVLYTVWCHISGEAAGEIWNWSFLGVRGLKGQINQTTPKTIELLHVGNRLPEKRLLIAATLPCLARVCFSVHKVVPHALKHTTSIAAPFTQDPCSHGDLTIDVLTNDVLILQPGWLSTMSGADRKQSWDTSNVRRLLCMCTFVYVCLCMFVCTLTYVRNWIYEYIAGKWFGSRIDCWKTWTAMDPGMRADCMYLCIVFVCFF